jgi:hypothetical protein
VPPEPLERTERFADSIAELDAARFVGRQDVLGPIEELMDRRGPGRVLFMHGPGGIGKSALLREIARRARIRRRDVRIVDGRLLEPSARALAEACGGPDGGDGPVILIDSFEQISALAGMLRDQVLPALSADALVIIAGRARPGATWFRDGWEHVVHVLELSPLSDGDAEELLARYGIGVDAGARLRAWAKGSPLALHVAAAAAKEPLLGPQDLASAVASRLVGDDLADVDAEVIAVAAIARAVDERLIAAVLPHQASGPAFRHLRELSVVEPYGTRIALHDLVREAIIDDLRQRDRDTYRRLVGRIADHLHERVVAGEYQLLDDLLGLFEDPLIRAAYSRGRGARFRAGGPEPGDAERLAERLGAQHSQWWPGVARFFTSAPETVTVVRSAEGELAGFAIAMTTENAPAWARAEDAVISRCVADAESQPRWGKVLIYRECVDLTAGTPGSSDATSHEVLALLNYPAALVTELPYCSLMYGAIPVDDHAGLALREVIGARPRSDLTIQDGERTLTTVMLNVGPQLQVGQARDMIYEEQGLVPRSTEAAIAAANTGEALRAALQNFHDPVALAANPLAEGAGVAERAESVRARLRSALETVFGTSEDERRARQLIERAYLDPTGGHRPAMAEQHLTRSTYFRRLAEARDRLDAVR